MVFKRISPYHQCQLDWLSGGVQLHTDSMNSVTHDLRFAVFDGRRNRRKIYIMPLLLESSTSAESGDVAGVSYLSGLPKVPLVFVVGADMIVSH